MLEIVSSHITLTLPLLAAVSPGRPRTGPLPFPCAHRPVNETASNTRDLNKLLPLHAGRGLVGTMVLVH